jgi:biotin carboxyl carrier protein
MKRYRITLDGETFSVEVLDDPRRSPVRVRVDGELFTVSVAAEQEEPAGEVETVAAAGTFSPEPAGVLTAPLPGVVKSIAIRTGQTVAAGDELLVIEAMKMDNVIRAPRGGTVGRVYVVEGRPVAYGERLLEIDG